MKRNSILEARRTKVSSEIKESVNFSFEIVDRIHNILQGKNMKQKDLAYLLSKSEAEVSKWMRGNHNFTISTIKLIEKVLGERILEVSSSQEEPKIIPIFVSLPFDANCFALSSTLNTNIEINEKQSFEKEFRYETTQN